MYDVGKLCHNAIISGSLTNFKENKGIYNDPNDQLL